ncbi:MAG TPA: AI-2E family transporter [Anaerolineae bacterium]|nr:AI-2E family transporter [Anaerolineae bacterium]MCB9109112.1 AI-2E family transporter [Anaerolineales bacterium]HRV96078.1 AI-2E family transporter [Anaerolineae bacterium]
MNHVFAQSQVARFMLIAIGAIAIVAAMRAISPILNPVFIAVLFVVLFDVPRSWLIKRGMSQGGALAVTIVGAILLTLLFLIIMGRTFLNLTASLPEYQQQLQIQLAKLGAMLQQYGVKEGTFRQLAASNETNPLSLVTYVLSGVLSLLSSGVLILVYIVFLLIEVSGFPAKLNQAFNPSEPAHQYISTVSANLRSFLVAQTQVSLVTGVGVTVALWVLGIPFALLWGFVAFLMNFIPYIGSILAAVPAVIVAFIQYGPSMTVLWVILAFLAVNIIVNYTIYPRVMSQGVDLSMFVVLAAMVFWGWVLGPIGLILSVPITAVIKISLDSYPGSRWLAVMLGSGPKAEPQPEGTSPAIVKPG